MFFCGSSVVELLWLMAVFFLLGNWRVNLCFVTGANCRSALSISIIQ